MQHPLTYRSPDDSFRSVCDLTSTTGMVGSKPFVYGGYSDIWRGYEWGTGAIRSVAIKIIRSVTREKLTFERIKKRISREIIPWSAVTHPNILPFYGLYWVDGPDDLPAMVYPYCEGGNCSEFLINNPSVYRMGIVADGLHHLHSFNPPIAHGDIRAANILMQEDGTPLIADFGLSRVLVEISTGLTTSSSKGGYRWMAPELFGGVDSRIIVLITTASDVWAFGCLCLEILLDALPWASTKSDAAIMSAVVKDRLSPPLPSSTDESISHIMRHCWMYEPAQRPSMLQLVDALFDVDPERLHLSPCVLLPTATFSDPPHAIPNSDLDSFFQTFLDSPLISSGSQYNTRTKTAAAAMPYDSLFSPRLITPPHQRDMPVSSTGANPYLEMMSFAPSDTSSSGPVSRDEGSLSLPMLRPGPRRPSKSIRETRVTIAERKFEKIKNTTTAPTVKALQKDQYVPKLKAFGGVQSTVSEETRVDLLNIIQPTFENSLRVLHTEATPGVISENINGVSTRIIEPEKSQLHIINQSKLHEYFESQHQSVPSSGTLTESPAPGASTSLLMDIAYPKEMSTDDMFECLTVHGCPDLTSLMNPKAYSKGFVVAGGFGDIWKGRLYDETAVAIKVWRFRTINEDAGKDLKRAMREIYNWSKLEHKNIHKLLGVIVFEGRLGMVSKWMEKGNLQNYLHKNKHVDRYPLCIQLAQGVEYLHNNNIIHGDLKAINVLVSSEDILKLTDFDHSIMAECTLQFSETTRIGGGTLRWMAPELVLDSEAIHQRSTKTDIYALGMTFLETITGAVPYAQQCRADINIYHALTKKVFPRKAVEIFGSDQRGEGMWALLMGCWHHDPVIRPTAREVLVTLQALMRETQLETLLKA